MKLKVSVIIPVYNDHASFAKCLDSVLQQTYENIEIIVVDDCSEPPIVIPQNDRLKIIHLKNSQNKGVAYCRNLGVGKSTGDLLSFLDSDDTISRYKIETQVELWTELNQPKNLVIGSGVIVRDLKKNNETIRIPKDSRGKADFYSGIWFFPGSAIILSKSFFLEVGEFDEKLRRLEDFEFFIRASEFNCNFVSIKVPLAKILRSRRARLDNIYSACALIIRKHFKRSLALNQTHSLVSYLFLEIGANALFKKRYLIALPALVLSLLTKPRVTVHLQNWWTTETNLTSLQPNEHPNVRDVNHSRQKK